MLLGDKPIPLPEATWLIPGLKIPDQRLPIDELRKRQMPSP